MVAPLLKPTTLRDMAGWGHVSPRCRSHRRNPPEPSSSLWREGLERSIAIKRWDHGRCFWCLERDHQISACHNPFIYIRCRGPNNQRMVLTRSLSDLSCLLCSRPRSLQAELLPTHPTLSLFADGELSQGCGGLIAVCIGTARFPFLSVARIPMLAPIWTLFCSPGLPCCAQRWCLALCVKMRQ